MDIHELATFLGFCAVINIGLLSLTSLSLFIFKQWVVKLHGKLTGVDTTKLPELYFTYLANYKLGILLFNLVPYIALKLMF